MSQMFRQERNISRTIGMGILWGVLWAIGIGAGVSGVHGAQESSEPVNPDAIWQRDIDEAGAQSAKDGRLLLLHLWASGDEVSRKMEQEFYGNPEIAKQLTKDYLCVPINGPQNADLLKKLGLPVAFPTDLVLRINGEQSDVLSVHRGEIPPRKYLETLRTVAEKYRRPQATTNGEERSPLDETTLPIAQPLTPESDEIPDARFDFGTPPATPSDVPAAPPQVSPLVPMDQNRFATSNTPVVSTELELGIPNQSRFASEETSFPELPELPEMTDESESAEPVDPRMDSAIDSTMESSSVESSTGSDELPEFPDRADGTEPMEPPLTSLAGNHEESAIPISVPGLPSTPQIVPPEVIPAIEGMDSTTIAGFTPEESQRLRKAPPLILDGCSPVAITTSMQWVRGDVRYGVVHRGHTYLFSSEEESRTFLADPERYAPALSGYDVVTAVQERKLVPGVREVAARIAGRIWLFTSEEHYNIFAADPERYIGAAEQIVQKSEQQAAREARYRNGSLFR